MCIRKFPVLILMMLLAAPLAAKSDFEALRFRCVGPTRGGRVTAVSGVAQKPGTFYMGSTGGGVWKSSDYGQNWQNCSDGYFDSPSIGAIAVAPANPQHVVVGTGSEGIRSNVIAGCGVYGSRDGGQSWQFLGLKEAGQIGAVLIHPENEDEMLVAALGNVFGPSRQRGIFRSTDGGRHWRHVLFVSDTTGAVDLEYAPDNPDVVYASVWRAERKPWTIVSGGEEGGIYRSTDGGITWKKLHQGLPRGLVGKSDLAVSAAHPARVYALIEAEGDAGGLYRSDDHGEHFTLVSTESGLLDRPFYYCNVDADPADADVVYVSATSFWRSQDGGSSWQRRSTPHGDNHDLWIDPADSRVMIQANDGGANVSRDGGETWSSQNNQPTAELYQVNVDDRFPYWLYAGQQDRSTIRVPSLPPYNAAAGPSSFWQSVGGCETGPAVPKPGDADIVYANCKGCFGRFNQRTGQEKRYFVGAANLYGHNPRDLKYRFQRVSPILVSPHDAEVVYHASQYVHRSTDEGVTWTTISPDLTAFESDKQVISGSPITRDITGEEYYSCLYALAESPLEKGVLWAGSNDGPIHISRNGGKKWTDVTPAGLPSGGRVQTIEASPHKKGRAYACVLRYQLNDWQPYVFKTENYGKSWERMVTGLPEQGPIRVVREDTEREGLLFAGGESGFYCSFDHGKHWQSLQLNLPVTPVTDIKIKESDVVLSTMGRGFWILDNIEPLRQWRQRHDKCLLYEPATAYRMRYWSRQREGVIPEYRQAGAAIDFYIPQGVRETVELTILDEKGRPVRHFSSAKNTAGPHAPDLDTGETDLTASGAQRLRVASGLNRFVWDMRHAGSWRVTPSQAGARGPLAVPGKYKVKMKCGDFQAESDLLLEADPRVLEDGVTIKQMEAQLDLRMKVGRLASRARYLAHVLDNGGDAHKALRDRLVTAEGRYPMPMLLDQISYLDGMLSRADQKPGRDAYARLAELESLYLDVLIQYRALPEGP